ncbi:ESX-1 secretion-associated protein EspI [Mycobacteroides abscessus subsp. bolletii]|uniref:AAA family ATPase n=1 Tax=Mycobacteroides abscessus TaxID=36809 RepID=UPI00092AEE81|nr:AAA family ATPase [Mycobacteroides abscessus]SHZ43520.1 ESX-1 secretion-associated protein EspI [Mycobacteroides abscessus subsp. bolletii]SKQ55042.1 ESX-1 secretion-associated protein EspI [Mycobacteroides abscessus subsp. bolletii]SKQ87778.1 ESX-1 secretion-associated protein EspI [Mycobacteroides abscessus subsp. bolletii]SKQ93626.1 ESX-1 secretion-associated protein EspI [Mycobacteroides abscessus subsp. bolletii]
MPKQDRGAPPRPPWLPEEDEQRGFLRSLRRKKRHPDEGEPNDESLTHETERPSAPKTAAQKPSAESVKLSGQGRPTLTSGDETADGDQPVSDLSKYYTPPRRAEPADDSSSASEPIAVPGPVAESDAQAPRIVRGPSADVAPEPRPTPQVEQLSSSVPVESSAMPEQEPEVPASNPVAESAPAVTGEPEPPLQAAATPEMAHPVVPRPEQSATGPERVVVDAGGADPFSRFSLLEAQLRQMSLDESITDDELARHRRHAAPEAEPTTTPAAALSFTPPEVVASTPDGPVEALEEAQAAVESPSEEPAPAPALGFTAPEPEDDVPAVDREAVGARGEPEAAVTAVPPIADQPEPNSVANEPAADQTSDFSSPKPEEGADSGDSLVPQAPAVEQSPAAEVVGTPASAPAAGGGDADARAGALLQRIEARRAELDDELAAHDAADAQARASEPEPAPFVPMVAPWASVPEPVRSPAPEAAAPADDADETADTATSSSGAAELEGFAPLVDEDIVISAPAVYEEAAADAGLDDVISESELPDESETPAARAVDPGPAGETADVAPESPAPESPAQTPTADRQEESGSVVAPEPRSAESSPWQNPSAVEVAAGEPQATPAYYVPPAASPQPDTQTSPAQEPAAQVPLGWSPPQPYPGQWPQSAPPAAQAYGGQQFPSQPPPQPTSVQGQWQWVPQQPQGPQSAAQQEPPAGYPPPPPQGGTPPANYRAPQAYRMPPSLDEAEVINRGRYAPRSGWRKAVHRSTGGRVNPGDSRKDRERDLLLASIRQPILGDYRIAVLSIKGGVGKTTTTLGLGSAFATIRTDRIIAVDANPDRGTLAERVRDHSTQSTVRDLLNDQNIRSYADVRNHTRMATSRLEVLASEQDPAVSEAFGEIDYRNTIDILQRYYNIILTDCGTGIMHSAMAGVLDLAHTIVLVSSPAMDSARSASATLDWLMQHGYSSLVREAHVVLSASRPGSAGIKLDKVYEHFQARCRSMHMIPFDPHLAEGADVDFNLLNADTNAAYLKLAGAISESFPRLRVRGDEQR